MKALNKYPLLEFLLVFALVVVARLPYLLSKHLYFDGDEALLGIMARDLLHLDAVPVYFYGQRYGLAILEVISTALFMPFFGSTVWTLKFGGMLLMAIAFWRLMVVIRTRTDSVWVYILTLIALVNIPPWTVHDRYLTAFLFACLVFERIILKGTWNQKDWVWISLFLVMILLAQPIYLLFMIPLLSNRIMKKEQLQLALKSIVPGIAFLGLLRIPAMWNKGHWKPVRMGEIDWGNLHHYLIEGFWSHCSGFFAYSDNYPVPTTVKIGVAGFLILLISAMIFIVLKGSSVDRKGIFVLVVSLVFAMMALPFFGVAGARYLLGFHVVILFLFISVVITITRKNRKAIAAGLPFELAFLLLTQTGFDEYTSFWFEPELNDMQMLAELHETLDDRGIEHVFVSEWNLLWQLNYLGDEKIAARLSDRNERIDRYMDRVDTCYHTKDCSYALAGSHWPLLDMNQIDGWHEKVERINDRFYLMENPGDEFLEKGGFEFASP